MSDERGPNVAAHSSPGDAAAADPPSRAGGFRDAPVMMQTTDAAGRLIEVSDAWLQGLGYERPDVVGRSVFEFLTDDCRRYAQTVLKPEFDVTGRLANCPHSYRRKDGTIAEVEISARLRTDGTERYCVAVLSDVSARNAALRDLIDRERLYRETLAYAPILLVRWTADAKVIFVNGNVCEWTGRRREEILGSRLTDLFAGAEGGAPTAQVAAFRPDQPIRSRHQILRDADGRLRVISWTDRALFRDDDSLAEILSVGHDMTDLQQMSLQVREQNERLSRLYTELAEANEGLRQFGRILSHDLQEPLRKLVAFSQVLRVALDEGNATDGALAATVIQDSAQRAGMMVADLVRYCRITDTHLAREPVGLAELVEDSLADLAAEIEAAKAEIELDIGRQVLDADPVQAGQILVNLLSNAIKYRHPMRRPRVSVRCRPTDLGALVVEVADNGIGFEERYKAAIFEPFRRLHGQGDYAGSGIGLAICATAARRLGWQIDVTSRVGVGSTFSITIPAGTLRAVSGPIARFASPPRGTAWPTSPTSSI